MIDSDKEESSHDANESSTPEASTPRLPTFSTLPTFPTDPLYFNPTSFHIPSFQQPPNPQPTMAQQFDFAALQAAITNGLTAGQQAQGQPAAAGQAAARPVKSAVNKPTEFNRNITQYNVFKRQFKLLSRPLRLYSRDDVVTTNPINGREREQG